MLPGLLMLCEDPNTEIGRWIVFFKELKTKRDIQSFCSMCVTKHLEMCLHVIVNVANTIVWRI